MGLLINDTRNSAVHDQTPLTSAQKLIWIGQRLAGPKPLYNLALSFILPSELDVPRFRTALDALVRDADVLQTRIFEREPGDADTAVQWRDRSIETDCEELDLADLAAATAWGDAAARRYLNPAERCFRVAFLHLDDGRHVLFWCQHHIVTDGSSIPLIVDALAARYRGDAGPLPSFHALARELNALDDEGAAVDEHRRRARLFWASRSERTVAQPVYYAGSCDGGTAATRLRLRLDARQAAGLRKLVENEPGFRSLSRHHGEFVVYATVLAALTRRLQNDAELRVGFVSHARSDEALRHMLGLLLGIGFLDVAMPVGSSFRDLARRVHRDSVVALTQLPTGIQTQSTRAQYAVSVNLLSATVKAFAGMPLDVYWHGSGHIEPASALDLHITDFDDDGVPELLLDLNHSVFGERERQWFLRHFEATLDAVLDDPDSSIDAYPLLSGAERDSLLARADGGPPAVIAARSIGELFARQLARHRNDVAVCQGARRLSFGALDEQASEIARALMADGVRPGDAVALCMHRDLSMYPAMLGIMKAGGVYVPLDPAHPPARLRYMLEHSGTRWVLSDRASVSALEGAEQDIDGLRCWLLDDDSERLKQRAGEVSRQRLDAVVPTDHAYICYTSGTTGLPKGVIGLHSATLNRFAWMYRRYPFTLGEVACQKTALSFVDSIWELFGPLCQGVPVVVIPDSDVLDIYRFIDTLQREGITRLVLVPSLLSVLLSAWDDIEQRLSSLRLCVVSGEPLPPDLARSFLRRLPHARLVNLYGSTEVTADVTWHDVSFDSIGKRVPIGRPLSGCQVHVLDASLALVPEGCIGELCVAGIGLSGGYHADPELNRQKFVPNPFGEGLLFRTGDRARYDGDLLVHHGRADSQVKIRGHRIELAEIELALREHPELDSAVVGVADGDQLEAAIVPNSDRDTLPDGDAELIARVQSHLSGMLPAYMIPGHFRILDSIPLMPNGKIDRKALALLMSESSPLSKGRTEPETETEALLAELWRDVLVADNDEIAEVDLEGDFFAVGGNSISAMRIVVALRRSGYAVSLNDVVEQGSVAAMAAMLDRNPVMHLDKGDELAEADMNLSGISAHVEALRTLLKQHPQVRGDMALVEDVYGITSAQLGILYHMLLQGVEQPLYLMHVHVDVFGDIRRQEFDASWRELIARHPALRTFLVQEGLDEPLHVTLREVDFEVRHVDLRHIADRLERRQALDRLVEEQVAATLPLDRAPIMHIHLFRLEDDAAHMLVVFHHVLMDGWSMALLANEFQRIYVARLQGRPANLPPAGNYRDHVRVVNGMNRENAQAFWREELDGFQVPTPLYRSSAVRGHHHATGNYLAFVDEISSSSLYAMAKECHVSPNVILQLAWAILLGNYNRTDDVVFGTAVSGRSSGIGNYENTVGMFVNSVPRRIRLDDRTNFRDLLRKLQREQASLVEYESTALYDIQKLVSLESNDSLFETLLIFQNFPPRRFPADCPVSFEISSWHENSHMPVSVQVLPNREIMIQAMYVTELVPDRILKDAITHFINIVKMLLQQDLDQALGTISLESESDTASAIAPFNATARAYPRERGMVDLFLEQAAQTPNAAAVSCLDERLSYRELADRCNELAAFLVGEGLGRGDLIALYLPRGIDMLVAMLAIQRAGAAYLPLDPEYPGERIEHILSDSGAVALIRNAQSRECVHEGLRIIDLDLEAAAIAQAGPFIAAAGNRPDDLAYVIYTSGSTGLPKGVRVMRRNLVNFLHSMARTPGMAEGDSLLAVTTIAFDIAALELLLPLIAGARVDIATREMTFDGEALAERMRTEEISHMQATPTTWRLMLNAGWTGGAHVKALVGGEALPRDLAGNLLPVVGELWNMYGPTETTVWSSCGRVHSAADIISIGKPIDNTEIVILDQNDRLSPIGLSGEICIAGEGVTLGYVNRDELTAAKFIPDPRDPQSGNTVYRTGDLGRWLDNGDIECLGRMDSQMKLRGYRIEPGEIEHVLAESPSVAEAVVTLCHLEDKDMLVAYIAVVSDEGQAVVDEADLRQRVRDKLPHYMMPAIFMPIDEVPRTPNGKTDRKALPAPGGYEASRVRLAEHDDVALPQNQPATATETTLCDIWKSVLGRDAISIHSNFFDLGGNSISAMQIVSTAARAGLQISLLGIFEHGSIHALAREADGAMAGKADGTLAGEADVVSAAGVDDKPSGGTAEPGVGSSGGGSGDGSVNGENTTDRVQRDETMPKSDDADLAIDEDQLARIAELLDDG